jgi:hypothetical protein
VDKIKESKININEQYVELRPSTVCNGVGVFAIKDIAIGTDIFYNSRKDKFYTWDVITDTEVKKLIERLCHTNELGFYISDHPVNLGMSYYVNHHDVPNVEYNEHLDTYIAIKNITKGQELLTNYPKREQDWLT